MGYLKLEYCVLQPLVGTLDCSRGPPLATVDANKIVGRKSFMPVQKTFRRCHICGTVCESARSIRRCYSCGKPFAPFFYFNDEYAPVLSDGQLRPTPLENERLPIHGLTAYWQNE